MDRRTVNVEEGADILGVHPQTVRGAIKEGRIPALRLGRRVLIPLAELDRLLEGAGEPGSGDRSEAEISR